MEAGLKQEEEGDDIMVYQRLAQIEETQRPGNHRDLYVVLYSFVVMGYKKVLGLANLGTLLSVEILAKALKIMGSLDESRILYEEVAVAYEGILTLACQNLPIEKGLYLYEFPGPAYGYHIFRPTCHYVRARQGSQCEGKLLDLN